MQNSPYRRRKGIIFISVSSRNKKSIFCCRSRTLFYKERLETPSKDIFETKRTAWKERHCANGWRCFDFVQRLRERSIKKRITRHLNALDGQRPTSLSTCQNRRWYYDTIFSTRGEGTTVNPRINFAANQSERGVYEKNISPDYAEMDEGSPCFRRVNRLVSLRKRRPINSKWTPIKRDDQKFNGTEMLARVTFYHRREEFHRLNILYRWFFI